MQTFQVAINRSSANGAGEHTHYYVILHQGCAEAESLALKQLVRDFPNDSFNVQFCKVLKSKKRFPLFGGLISE